VRFGDVIYMFLKENFGKLGVFHSGKSMEIIARQDTDSLKSFVIVSYVPLLWPQDLNTQTESIEKAIEKSIDSCPNGEIAGCAWIVRNGKLSPVFVLEKSREMVEHLKFWSEDKPEQWFKIHFRREGLKYFIALVPEVDKTVERFKISYQLRTGYPLPKETPLRVIFKYLYFSAQREEIHLMDDEVEVFYLDSKDMDKNDLQKSVSEAKSLGTFKIVNNSELI